jgi:hypothetical protein
MGSIRRRGGVHHDIEADAEKTIRLPCAPANARDLLRIAGGV